MLPTKNLALFVLTIVTFFFTRRLYNFNAKANSAYNSSQIYIMRFFFQIKSCFKMKQSEKRKMRNHVLFLLIIIFELK
ncbi:uncharacterized protein Dvar_10780 [Desulfosarcina variabilis str. Montpellier]